MKKNAAINTVMSTTVHTVHTGEKVSDVRKLMAEHRINHVPVVSGGEVVGIISSADMLGISVEGVDSDQRSMDAYLDHQFTIEGLMTKDIVALSNTAHVRDAAEVLAEGRFHAMPVVDGDKKLVGIITTTDLIRFLKDLL